MTKQNQALLLELKNVQINLNGRPVLKNINWAVAQNQHWAIIGPNGSGKSTLARSLWGAVDPNRGRIILHFAKNNPAIPAFHKAKIGYVGYELAQNLIQEQTFQDQYRSFQGKPHAAVTQAQTIIKANNPRLKTHEFDQLIQELGIKHLLASDLRSLSSGELKKVLLARALVKKPKILILDEPFDGLDQSSQKQFTDLINRLTVDNKFQLILITHRAQELPPAITHVLVLKQGRIKLQTTKIKAAQNQTLRQYLSTNQTDFSFNLDASFQKLIYRYYSKKIKQAPDYYVRIQKATVFYGGEKALDQVDFVFKKNQNWLIQGPNGSGKSTLVKLITADHTQTYANNIWIFGQKRGTGESIWQIKQNIGLVSGDLQLSYTKPITALEVALSGFFDSIGLYRQANNNQRTRARAWFALFNLKDLSQKRFDQLSNGQKRMVLIIRALVKMPLLLILDEPETGLDLFHRQKLYSVINQIVDQTPVNLLLVSHYRDIKLTCLTDYLQLNKGRIVRST
ncbi:MAG: ATP-binding cassette domain-containing protein [Candidatus Moranbacteria bacterium]|nr:ATP-binding cassette domain-containing protein [Candidatus Moranbacteria bacterium]